MESLPNARSVLSCDDEFASVRDKFDTVERSLDRSCDVLESLIRRLSITERRLGAARRDGRADLVRLFRGRLRKLSSLYNVYHVVSEAQSDQLAFLDGAREDDQTLATLVPLHGDDDDFMTRQ